MTKGTDAAIKVGSPVYANDTFDLTTRSLSGPGSVVKDRFVTNMSSRLLIGGFRDIWSIPDTIFSFFHEKV